MGNKQRKLFGILGCTALFFFAAAYLPINSSSSAKVSAAGAKGGEQAWRLGQPVTYENLTVFPILTSQDADTSEFATLDDALASGDALVTEQGNYLRRTREGVAQPAVYGSAQVNQLVLVNRGKKPLLLLAGEVVSGGKQDRIIGKDRLVPVGAAPLPLDVFCVEHGRWTGGSDKFVAAKTMVHPSVREKAAVEQNQSEVWAAVRGDTSPMAGAAGGASQSVTVTAVAPEISTSELSSVIALSAPTQSYRKIYQSKTVEVSVEAFALELERRFNRATSGLKGEHVVGIVIAYGGEVVWSDAFASSELFDTYWPKLLRSYVVEALTRPATTEKASIDDARDFLQFPNIAMQNTDGPAFDKATGHVNEESEPGVYIWQEVTGVHKTEIRIEALAPKQITLHWLKVLRAS
jgi:hypothetical protein